MSSLSRIMIFGRPGSGKSTFAVNISKQLKLPVYHLDKYFYQRNWKERNYQEFIAIQQSFINKEKWIIDGNSIKSLEMRFQRAHMVLFINLPRWRCYLRILKRRFNKNPLIDDRAQGCQETIRMSLIRYMWDYDQRVGNQIIYLREKYPSVIFCEITSDHALANTVASLSKGPDLQFTP